MLALVLGVSRPASGWLTDKFGLEKILFPALVIFASSFFIVGYSTSLGTLLVGSVIASIGSGSFQPAIYSMCILSETPIKRGVASNIYGYRLRPYHRLYSGRYYIWHVWLCHYVHGRFISCHLRSDCFSLYAPYILSQTQSTGGNGK